jgi:hypothetical protein
MTLGVNGSMQLLEEHLVGVGWRARVGRDELGRSGIVDDSFEVLLSQLIKLKTLLFWCFHWL